MATPPFLLTAAQMRRLSPHFPLSHGKPRVDYRLVPSGIIYLILHRLQSRDAPAAYGSHKTLYNRFIRWSRMGVFDRIFAALAAKSRPPERLMIDSTHRRPHRTAAGLLQEGPSPLHRPHHGAGTPSSTRTAMARAIRSSGCSPNVRRVTIAVQPSCCRTSASALGT